MKKESLPKSKKEMMRKLRKARRDAGLTPVTYWLTPEQKKSVDKLLYTWGRHHSDNYPAHVSVSFRSAKEN